MKRAFIIPAMAILAITSGNVRGEKTKTAWFDAAIKSASVQTDLQIKGIEQNSGASILNPVTTQKNRHSTGYCKYTDWRSGFFPGSLWYLYELTGDTEYLKYAQKYTEAISEAQHMTRTHDIGFIINCSYGNGRRFMNRETYDSVLVTAAKNLCTRFKPGAGIIQSWNTNPGSFQERKGWTCPVIIDNMMNLELLFEATKISGDPRYRKIALSHADRTLKEHFRPNASCYHVIDYNPETGEVLHRMTAQGYSDESSWSRGQAWAIYGYTMCFRETGDRRYLDQALRTFDYMRNNVNMPSDKIPYWDMNAPDVPFEPRDASSAAIIASALYEISTYIKKDAKEYKEYADAMLESLSSPEYLARPGDNGRFILMHSTGSLPSNKEVDVPLNYADYYYLEALKRKKDIEEGKGFVRVNYKK